MVASEPCTESSLRIDVDADVLWVEDSGSAGGGAAAAQFELRVALHRNVVFIGFKGCRGARRDTG